MRVLCVFGEHNYGSVSRGVGIEYACFLPALRRLGHEVAHFDCWDRTRFGNFAELNSSLLASVERERPDVVLAVPLHYEIWTETLLALRERGDVATVCWTTDDTWKYDQFSRLVGPYYDAMATTYPDVVARYARDGILNVVLTQWAANSEWLQAPLPASMCRYGVTFVGAAYGDRPGHIQALRQAGIEVRCFGHGWPDGVVPAEDIPRVMRDSVVSLNFAGSPDHRGGQRQVKARTFEVPGAGGFLLTETAPGLERFYTAGDEIAVFDGEKELVDQVRYYLSHEADRDRIARAGNDRTCREHTYESRLAAVLDYAVRSRRLRGSTKPTHEPVDLEHAYRSHRLTPGLSAVRMLLMTIGVAIWGAERGPRAARRMLFEASWRVAGARTYSAAGWPGRMFYRWS